MPLSAAAIEAAHDTGIAFTWPGIEPVQPRTCINLNALLSAEQQPYQHCFGEDLYPTLEDKAAYLFFHLTTSHIFENGNKRTAVLCLDAFLLLNEHLLALSNDEVHDLAQGIAESGERGERPARVLERVREIIHANLVPFELLIANDLSLKQELARRKLALDQLDLIRVGAPLQQFGEMRAYRDKSA